MGQCSPLQYLLILLKEDLILHGSSGSRGGNWLFQVLGFACSPKFIAICLTLGASHPALLQQHGACFFPEWTLEKQGISGLTSDNTGEGAHVREIDCWHKAVTNNQR